MGRIFEKRKHTMFKRWDRMAKAFTRVGKEIAIAVRGGGPNPDHNPALRRAIQNARACNMPKDKVENAIAKAAGDGADDYQELVYEGYAPHGIALLIETATDNPTRTVANIRNHFKKCDGSIGSSGSVSFMFDKMGVFKVSPDGLNGHDPDELQLDLMDHGLEEWTTDEDEDGNEVIEIRCAFNDFGSLQAALEERGIEPASSQSEWRPQNTTELGDEQIEEVLKLVDRLEQDDDVQNVFHTLA
ncbi:MAG: YebC/PmpR family DNA-binding transcriptional regulator [Alphaproteobacteria bacterium]|nr:YebC/PmpR family DNA-binding transcriptional regulator [Alphaproteobacteria bacterium]